ncbi:MAG: magnesium and cobalt exporter, family [Frankiaceae bacterium]|jgi:putative hemolysin|nr:magnesium and cobalt exporter, family [Frankiaceae bacterium]
MPVWGSALVVVALIVVEAVFVASEMALVTLREGQVRALADSGRRGAKVAHLVENPNRFLSAVQIGVTTTALLSSAFGAVTLSDSLARAFRRAGLGNTLATVLGFLLVTLVIAYITLVVGELAPKRVALQRAESTASAVAPTLDRFARMMRPVIWLLSVSTDVVVRLLGGDPNVNRERITEEELRDLVTAHEALTREERRLIDEVFEAGERQLREVMVPRTEVEFLDAGWSVSRAVKLAAATPHSRFPIVRGSHDEVVGFVHLRDLYSPAGTARRGLKVGELARDVLMLPATKRVLPALSEMRRSGDHLAVVVDEYGGTAGIVTLEDLIEELIGEIRDEYDVVDDDAKRLRGGDIEVDGLLNLDDFADETRRELPEGPYETVAGCLMSQLGRLPRQGDAVEVAGMRLKVTKMDGRRVARVRVTLLDEPAPTEAAPTDGSGTGE